MFYICCSRCKKSLPKSAAFCRRCGLEVREWSLAQVAAAMRPVSAPKPRRSSPETWVIAAGTIAVAVVMIGFLVSRTSRVSERPATVSVPVESEPEAPPVSYTQPPSGQPQTVYVPVPQYVSPVRSPLKTQNPSVTSPFLQRRHGAYDPLERLREIEAINQFNRENQPQMVNPPGVRVQYDPWGRPIQQPGTPGPYGY